MTREGPHIRLGLAWAATTVVAAAVGPVVLALVLTPVAALAAAQAARSWRRRRRPAAWPVSAGGAGLIVIASAFGLVGVIGAVLVIVDLLVLAEALLLSAAKRPRRRADPLLTALIAAGFGLAGAAPVLLRSEGLVPAFVLLSFVHVYDASAYIVGSGAAAAWEGSVAGVASIAAVTLAVAAVLSPPFRGASPWLFGLLAAALTPMGPLAASELLGDRGARVPALRRLDSLLVVGPVWALAAAVALD
ncbi:MAG: phosphatidate cytidylyltransferase [Actinomycetota bacterium]|nr:phosphatidate cytidylyltransferase [Actinomycetota bacterium]